MMFASLSKSVSEGSYIILGAWSMVHRRMRMHYIELQLMKDKDLV